MAKNKHTNGNGTNSDPRKPGYELAAEIAHRKWHDERERADELESQLIISKEKQRELSATVRLLEARINKVRDMVQAADALEFYELHQQLMLIGREVGFMRKEAKNGR